MKKICLTLIALALTSIAFAREPELNLACVATNSAKLQTREILVSEDGEVRALQTSSAPGAKTVKLNRYAVVINLNAEDESKKWEVLSDEEFELTVTRYAKGEAVEFKFNDKRNDDQYGCGLNGTVHANPAVSRSN